MVDICFVVMPFGSVHRPALGVSLLKAASTKIGFSAKIHYFNLKLAERIGLDLHDRLAETSLDSPLIGELIFAGFAFRPGYWTKKNISNMVYQIFDTKHYSISLDKVINEIMYVQSLVAEFLDDCTYNILRQRPRLVGFTSTFEQNCASLALARRIKEEADIPIIFGGANCEGEMGSSLLKCAPWIDFVCSGEGDIAFIEFVKSFLSGQTYSKINGILTRESTPIDIALTNPVMNLYDIPFPDFDDFFAALGSTQLKNDIDPELVIETSRGCWWGEKFQCTFCGLNGSTMKYRSKSVPRVVNELKYLTSRYKIKKFQVVDNILDLNYIDELFPQLQNQRLGGKFFYETKSNISKRQLLVMTEGGVSAIQPGIESLSDIILNIMKKGVTALQNIQLLKWCKEIGIVPLWNFIWGFPGEPEEEYDRMARLVPLLVHLHPPSGLSRIVLDRFSPYFVASSQNGIRNVRPWIAYKFLYPLHGNDLYQMAYHFDFDYFDGRDPSSYTKELELKLRDWKKLWENDSEEIPSPVLNMVNRGDLIMINDTRPCRLQSFYILVNEEAKVYSLCETMHSLNSLYVNIKEDFPMFKEKELRDVLFDLLDKKLILCDNGRYLSLAVPV
jgi:ribosomal peptide maturation radical SAM protein 1